MDIEYKGGNCIVLTTKKATIVVDAKLDELSFKNQATKATVELATQEAFMAPGGEDTLLVSGPGEYEVENISIVGIAAQAHVDAKTDPLRATMYRIASQDVSMVVVGHIYPELSEEQLEAIGVVDVLVVPVGGNGYTLDAAGALKIVKAVDPKVVIPTHYADSAAKYPVPQAELELFLKDLGAAHEETPKLKIKGGVVNEVLTVQVVTRTA